MNTKELKSIINSEAKEILHECFLGVIDFNEGAAIAAMKKYAKQQIKKQKNIKNDTSKRNVARRKSNNI